MSEDSGMGPSAPKRPAVAENRADEPADDVCTLGQFEAVEVLRELPEQKVGARFRLS